MGVSTPPVVSPCAKLCCAIKDDQHSVPAPNSSIVNDYISVDSLGSWHHTDFGTIYGGGTAWIGVIFM